MTTLASAKCEIAYDSIRLVFSIPDPAGQSDKVTRNISIIEAERLSNDLLEKVREFNQLKRNHKKERLATLKAEFQVLMEEIKQLEDDVKHGK